MKLITTIVAPERLDEIKAALRRRGVTELIVTRVDWHAAKVDHTEIYKSAAYAIDSTPRLKLETAVADELEDLVVDLFESARGSEGGMMRTLVSDVTPVRRREAVATPRAA